MGKKKILINSKDLANAFRWLGFEYTEENGEFAFENTWAFTKTWKDLRELREDAKKRRKFDSKYYKEEDDYGIF